MQFGGCWGSYHPYPFSDASMTSDSQLTRVSRVTSPHPCPVKFPAFPWSLAAWFPNLATENVSDVKHLHRKPLFSIWASISTIVLPIYLPLPLGNYITFLHIHIYIYVCVCACVWAACALKSNNSLIYLYQYL